MKTSRVEHDESSQDNCQASVNASVCAVQPSITKETNRDTCENPFQGYVNASIRAVQPSVTKETNSDTCENPFEGYVNFYANMTDEMYRDAINNIPEEADAGNVISMDQSGTQTNTLATVLFKGTKEDVVNKVIEEVINRGSEGTPATQGRPNPEIMDVRTVIEMLDELKVDMQNHLGKIVHSDLAINKKQEDKILELQHKVSVCEAKERIMVDAMANMSDKISELQQKLEIQDINLKKRAVIMTGLEASDKKHICKKQVESFLREEMEIDVVVEDVYHIGKNDPKEIVIILLSTTHKKLIFQNISKIQHYTNSKGKKYYFRDFLTTRQQEQKKLAAAVHDQVQTMDPTLQEEVTTMKGDVYIGETKYERKINPPDPTRVLKMPIQELNAIMGMSVKCGPTIRRDNNCFTGYVVDANCYDTVQRAYMKIKLNHADARHIICAWNLPGSRPYEATDCCDDEDYGSARPILDLMVKGQVKMQAIFVVRNCGDKLYGEGFNMYKEAACRVMEKYPKNDIAKEEQKLPKEEEEDQNIAGEMKRLYSETVSGSKRGGGKGGTRGSFQTNRRLRGSGRGRGYQKRFSTRNPYEGSGRGGNNSGGSREKNYLLCLPPKK